jgi:hypothetical protein
VHIGYILKMALIFYRACFVKSNLGVYCDWGRDMAIVRVRGSQGLYAAWAMIVRISHLVSRIRREE